MPRTLRFTFYLACASLASTAIAAVPNPLLSPWTGKPVGVTDSPYTCPALPQIPADLTTDGFYRTDDPTHSIIDPVRQAAYNASSGPVKKEGLAIVAAADNFRTTGSRQAAQCVRAHTLALAQQHSLAGHMSSNQAYYVQGWVVGAIAIAYLKLGEAENAAPEQRATPEQRKMIGAWMHDVGKQTRDYYDEHQSKDGGKGNNHLYWAGVELAAIGVVANNRSDFDWAMATYDNGVDQIRPDGTLPLEMARGSKALHYHLYALAPLVLLAEFGEANHLDLYAHAHGAIHRLVDVSVAGLQDPALFAKATGMKQEVPKVPSGDQIGWAPPYVRRFPNPALARMVAAAPSLSVYYLGGLPPN